MRAKTITVKEVDKVEKDVKWNSDTSPNKTQTGGRANSLKNLKAPWKKWQSWNPKWTPKRRTIEVCNAELLAEGYPPATKQQIEELYMSILNVWEEKLDQVIADKSLPMINRIVARNMKGGKGFDIIERMIDRSHGKAVQKEEVKHTWTVGVVDASKMSSAELDKYISWIAW